MLRLFFIIKLILLLPALALSSNVSDITGSNKTVKSPVVITSKTLTADNKNNTAIFEGSVVAKTDGLTIYSDSMTVYYDSSESKVKKIHASGNVKVLNNERTLFSKEATYLNEEEKIIFTGDPKAVEGENLITGTQIIFYLKEDRAVVEGSKVILQNKRETE